MSPLETVISLEDRRILNDMRISVERPFMKDWNLHLRNVSVTDAGVYKCQINTDPVGTKKINLEVTGNVCKLLNTFFCFSLGIVCVVHYIGLSSAA